MSSVKLGVTKKEVDCSHR